MWTPFKKKDTNTKSSVSDFLRVDELRDNLIRLIESKFELKKLELLGKVEAPLSKIIAKVIIGLFFFVAFIFLNILLAAYINHKTGIFWIGYACLFGFYTLVGIIMLIFKKQLIKKIEGYVAKEIVGKV